MTRHVRTAILGGVLLVILLFVLSIVAPSGSRIVPVSTAHTLGTFPPYPALAVNILPSSSALDLGQNLALRANVSGGSGVPANWNYTWSGLPTGCVTNNVANYSCTPTANSTWSVSVSVHDSVAHKTTASSPVSVVVNPVLTIAQFTNSAGPNLTLGYNFTLSVLESGGTAPFAYNYSGLFTNCTGGTSATVRCHAGAVGNYTFGVTVTDATGEKNTSSIKLVVTQVPGYKPPSPPPTTTVTQSGLGTTTYAEIAAILGVGAVIVATLFVKARRDERQTFKAIPTGNAPATAAGSSASTAPDSSATKTEGDQWKSGGKNE